ARPRPTGRGVVGGAACPHHLDIPSASWPPPVPNPRHDEPVSLANASAAPAGSQYHFPPREVILEGGSAGRASSRGWGVTEAEWLVCDRSHLMLRHLDGKVEDEAFMRFSVACCRRIWPLLSDPRSRAVVEATEAYLDRAMTAEAAERVCAEWDSACQEGE